jgi:hypothetical protein
VKKYSSSYKEKNTQVRKEGETGKEGEEVSGEGGGGVGRAAGLSGI